MFPSSPQTSGYDRTATMFSPDGRLYQVEYASKIVSQGTLGVALKYSDGVVFGSDKNISSKLVLPESIEKLFKIDEHIAAVSAGLVGDARRLVQIARQKAQENWSYYDEPIGVEPLVKDLSGINQVFTQYAGMRPFGVSFIVGGVDRSGFRLFETEPSGALAEYNAIGIGKNKNKAMDFFEKEYRERMSLDEGTSMLLKALSLALEEKEKMDYRRLEFAFIDSRQKFQKIPNEKLKVLLSGMK